jgi:hypothetical protein
MKPIQWSNSKTWDGRRYFIHSIYATKPAAIAKEKELNKKGIRTKIFYNLKSWAIYCCK